jgi:hypothetical protein
LPVKMVFFVHFQTNMRLMSWFETHLNTNTECRQLIANRPGASEWWKATAKVSYEERTGMRPMRPSILL